MKAKLDGFKFHWCFTHLAIVLIQCSLAKTDDADTELDAAKKSEKKDSKKAPNLRVLNGTHYDPPTEKLKDYVIVGLATDWEKDDTKIPVALKLSTGQRKKIRQQWYYGAQQVVYMTDDFDLSIKANPVPGMPKTPPSNYQLKIPAKIEYSDKSTEQVIVEVEVEDH